MANNESEAIGRWVREEGLDPGDPDFTLPPALLGRIDASRIVLLGECSHFTHEKSDFRLWWIEQLSRRWRIRLGEELGRSDARRINHYLATGDEAQLDQVPTFGYREDDRTDRDDRPTGVLRESHENYPTDLFKAEQTRFYRGVRALNRGVSLFGFDINGSLGSVYRDVELDLTDEPATPEKKAFLKVFAQVPGESMQEEQERLERAGDLLRELGASPMVREAAKDLLVGIHTLEFAKTAYPAEEYFDLNPAMAAREQLLKQQVRWALAELGPGEKLVLMAHAFHLARSDEGVEGQAGAGPGGDTESSLGHHLVQELGEAAFAVWMVHGGGDDSQPFPDLSNHFEYPDKSLNRMLTSVCDGERLLPTGPLEAIAQRFSVGHMYNSVASIDIRAQADIIHFLPIVTPMRR